MRWLFNKVNGSITVEASLVFPIVVMVIIPFLFLFRALILYSILEDGLDICLRKMASEMYILERLSVMPAYADQEEEKEIEEGQLQQVKKLVNLYTRFTEEDGWKEILEEKGFDLAGQILLKQQLKEQLAQEDLEQWGVQNGWQGLSMNDSRFLYLQEGHRHLIKGAISFEWNFSFGFWKPPKVQIERIFRCFVGEDDVGKNDSSEGGQEAEKTTVYRIGQGKHYHRLSCYLIQKNVFSTTRKRAEADGQTPCMRCKPEENITVYRTSGGEHYHTDSCTYLYPNISAMTLEEALQKGFTGCGICQGEKEYFS